MKERGNELKENAPLNIFIVDDDQMFLNVLGYELKKHMNVQITSFESAEACIDKLDKNPDLIFLDYHLCASQPENIDGLEALKKIKKLRPDQNVVMISGSENMDVLLQCLSFGACDYIIKTEFTSKTVAFLIFKLFNVHMQPQKAFSLS